MFHSIGSSGRSEFPPPKLIVKDDRPPTLDQRPKRLEVVVRWSRIAMENQQREPTRRSLVEFPDDAMPHTELPKREEAFTSC
jgi:hypothetical protein